MRPSTFLLLLLLGWLSLGGGTYTPRESRLSVSPSASTRLTFRPKSAEGRAETVTVGVLMPKTNFHSRFRAFTKKLSDTFDELRKSSNPVFDFVNFFHLVPESVFVPTKSSPIDILQELCKTALPRNFSVIFFLINAEFYDSTVASQYFFQFAGYLGIPVFSWSSYSAGLEQKVSKNVIMQMAPSLAHQSSAMLSILQRYSWHQFSIVTSHTAGHLDFVEAVKEKMSQIEKEFRMTLLSTVKVDTQGDAESMRQRLGELRNTETRIILLYSTREEAVRIFEIAQELGLIGKSYMWIVAQLVIGMRMENAKEDIFPTGMLGVYFDTSIDGLVPEIDKAAKVFGHGLELFVRDVRNKNVSLHPNLSCDTTGDTRWSQGETLVRYLRNVSFSPGMGKPNIEFNADGTLKYVELTVINLNANGKWEAFGSWTPVDGLEIRDIVWPGNALVPPPGAPEEFHLKVTFMEEPPFILLGPPDPVTGQCINRGVKCHVGRHAAHTNSSNVSQGRDNSDYRCCSGFSIDLLQKFATDLKFSYDLVRVEDGIWGAEVNGQWNGLVAALLHDKTDIVMTSFKINSMREAVIDFSIPFMETGIAIVVAKRTGIISPKAFLEPFDTVSWVMILIVSIHVAAFAIFLFEWLSPAGYNMTMQPPRDYKFSLLRTYWMVWADLFGASVNVDCPRSFSARFMSSVWAMFAVVFLAIYTANLAAFMITQEEYHDLTGIEDKRLANPYTHKPPFRYGTMPYGNTDSILQKNQPRLHRYMKQFNKSTIAEGIKAVKKGELDAFIYDATVLEYLVGQDEDCKLLTVGAWYAMTGFGIGFPRTSKHLDKFNHYMMVYRENGDLDRLQRFWLTGVCHPEKQERTSSNPLSLDQFMSAFILLSLGILLAVFLLLIEHVYYNYLRKHLAKKDSGGCCALVSLSMGQSLTFRGAVHEAHVMLKRHNCRDPVCETQFWKVKQELGLARSRIHYLERILRGADGHDRSKGLSDKIPASRKPMWRSDAIGERDMTRNHTSSNEPGRTHSPLRFTTYLHGGKQEWHQIAEMETVL